MRQARRRRARPGPAKATPAARPVDALSIEHIVGDRGAARVPARSARSAAWPTRRRPAARASCSRSRCAAGRPTQVTASEKNVSDPQWSPDGRRLAFVRDGAIAVVDADGSPARDAGPSPGRRIRARAGRPTAGGSRSSRAAAAGRRSGSSTRRSRAAAGRRPRPGPSEPRAVTPLGLDVDEYAWSPDGTRLAIAAERGEAIRHASRISVVTIADGAERPIGDGADWECGVRWLPDGGLRLHLGRRRLVPGRPPGAGPDDPDGRSRPAPQEHGEPGALFGLEAAAVAGRDPVRPPGHPRRAGRPRGQPARRWRGRRRARPGSPAEGAAAGRRRARPARSSPGRASGGRSAGCPTAPGSRRSARARRDPRTCGCCPFRAWHPTAPGRAS